MAPVVITITSRYCDRYADAQRRGRVLCVPLSTTVKACRAPGPPHQAKRSSRSLRRRRPSRMHTWFPSPTSLSPHHPSALGPLWRANERSADSLALRAENGRGTRAGQLGRPKRPPVCRLGNCARPDAGGKSGPSQRSRSQTPNRDSGCSIGRSKPRKVAISSSYVSIGPCRRRDSNPRHADYDSAALTD
jgi:hypothetical protein